MEKFFDYFDGRYRDAILSKPSNDDGPVITISRMTGCDARQVAESVVDSLNRRYNTTRWKWVDKEIIYAIAKELNTNPERIENFYKGIELSSVSEMIMAFSGGFVSDLRVKKAIRDVVLSICKDGHIVLIGRGGVAISSNVTDALHIRLTAPFYWRVKNIMNKKNLDIETSEDYIINNDESRFNLIQAFLDKKSANIDHLFDAIINRNAFSIADTADLIVRMYEMKIGIQIAERKRRKQLI